LAARIPDPKDILMSNHKQDLPDLGCQMQSFAKINREKETDRATRLSLISQVRLFFRRHLSLNTRRKLKKSLHLNILWQGVKNQPGNMPQEMRFKGELLGLQAGEWVRVRPEEQIRSTLDEAGKLKGCSFLNVMLPYCGTRQKVFKPVTRFVDERNYKIKTPHGIVLLEGVMCTGTEFYGKCDRSCLFFWREEWLERP
jgi:hypothetical protein